MKDQLCVLITSGEHAPDKVYYSLKKLNAELFVVFKSSDNERLNEIYNRWIPKFGDYEEVNSLSEMQKVVKERNKVNKITGILPLSESLLIIASKIAAELNLSFSSQKSIENVQNKYEQRQLLKNKDLPIPKFRLIKNKESLGEAGDYIGFPAVLKPVFGSGSYFVQSIKNYKELYETYSVFQNQYLNIFSENTGTNFFLLEEELQGINYHNNHNYGDYASVELIVFNSEIELLSITDNMPLKEPFRETGFLLPSILSEEKKEQLYKTSLKAIETLGLTHGIFQIELKFTIDGPKIIEVNPRPGAGTPYRINLAAPSYDFFYEYAGMFLNRKPNLPLWENYSGSFMAHSPNRKVLITQINDSVTEEGLFYKEILVKNGDIINPLKGAHNLVAYTYIKGSSHTDIFLKATNFEKSLKVGYEVLD